VFADTVSELLNTTSSVTPDLPDQDSVYAVPDEENCLPWPRKINLSETVDKVKYLEKTTLI